MICDGNKGGLLCAYFNTYKEVDIDFTTGYYKSLLRNLQNGIVELASREGEVLRALEREGYCYSEIISNHKLYLGHTVRIYKLSRKGVDVLLNGK